MSEFFLDDLGLMRNLGLVVKCDGSEPDLLNGSILSEKFLEILSVCVQGYISNKDSSLTAFLLLISDTWFYLELESG